MFDNSKNDDEMMPIHDDSSKKHDESSAKTWTNHQAVTVPTMDSIAGKRSMTTPPPPPLRESAARERMRRRRVKGRRSEWAWVMIAAVMLALVIFVGVIIFTLMRSANENVEVVPTAFVAELLPTPIDARTNFDPSGLGIGSELQLPEGGTIEIKPWDGESRFTMVMVGLDRRVGETGLAYRTDTIMLVSLDPQTQSVGLLSIPRDLYVQVPGYAERQRMNSPMVYGEGQQPGYGPTLLMQTVQDNLGIRVNDFLAVDFNAFVVLVDAIGGIDVDNQYTISDPQYPDMYYGYDPFYLSAGVHHLDGATALKFARTRHGDNDFERARRQQEVLYAIRDRILSLDMLPTLILQAPTLWNTLNESVYTGLSFEQVIQLAIYAKDIPVENITMGVIDGNYIRPYTTARGEQVLIPNQANIGILMTEIFGPNYDQE